MGWRPAEPSCASFGSSPSVHDCPTRRAVYARGRGGETSAPATTSLWRCGSASGGQRLTFRYREISPDALRIPPLEVEVGATKPRRRKPVPAPKAVGAAPRTAVPAERR
jgi:hypothetical protein